MALQPLLHRLELGIDVTPQSLCQAGTVACPQAVKNVLMLINGLPPALD